MNAELKNLIVALSMLAIAITLVVAAISDNVSL